MTVIVPTDFSATATNAARYAVQMLAGQYDVTVLLYHVYEKEGENESCLKSLTALQEELRTMGVVKTETEVEQGSDFITALDRLARHRAAELIVMGITGKSKIEQVFFGSNTLKMVEKNACPVLIIPPTAQFTQIKNVALSTDMREVKLSIPVVPIKNILKLFRPSLHIVNVNPEHYVSLTDEYMAERSGLQEMFGEFRPEFYFIGTNDLHDTLQQFVADKNVDMLITVPRNHSFFTTIFKTTNTKKMVYESAIPVLAAHE